jgi:hypothetical protein
MNKYLLTFLKTIFYLTICWFVGYFIFGENISVEFSDYSFTLLFPKILTFATGASIYFLFLLNIKKSEGFKTLNIIKFSLGIILGVLPFFLFKYYASVDNCQNWEVNKKVKSTLFISTTSNESIKLIEVYCPELNTTELKTYRIMQISPFFNTVYPVDTLKIKRDYWKKVKH